MDYIMIILKIKMAANRDYYSQTYIVCCMKLKTNMFMKILVKIKNVWL